MTLDIQKLKQSALDGDLLAVEALITRLEAEKYNYLGAMADCKHLEEKLEAANLTLIISEKMIQALEEKLESAEAERDTHRAERKLLSEAFAEQLTKLTAAEQDAARWKAFERCGEKLMFKENFGDKSKSYWHFNTKDSLQYIYKTEAEAVDAFISWNKP